MPRRGTDFNRLSAAFLLLLGVAGCATAAPDDDFLTTIKDQPRLSACNAELRAFVAVAKVARQTGDDWTAFEPAIEALKEQILDCVDDGVPQPLPIAHPGAQRTF